MLRTTIYSAGARIPQAMRPILRTTPSPLSSFAQRSISTGRLKPNPGTGWVFSSSSRATPLRNQTILQRLRSSIRSLHNSRRYKNGKSTSPNPTPNLNSPPKGAAAEAEPTTLGGRLKKLSREYGWSALGVYLMLSALDFPFCYLLVRYLGTDLIGEWEHWIISNVESIIPDSVKQAWHDWRSSMKEAKDSITKDDKIDQSAEKAGWGVEEAEERNKKEASLATQLALAYAIHKSFIFIRVPLTAAVTPKVVRVLRGWGWDIGKRTTKEAKAIRIANHRKRVPRAKKFLGPRK